MAYRLSKSVNRNITKPAIALGNPYSMVSDYENSIKYEIEA